MRAILPYVLACLLSTDASALDLPPYTLPATIDGHTFQEGAITIYNDGSYSISYYNRNALYPNPTHYAPYDRWDIWWSEKVTCTGNDFANDTSCTWNYVDAHDPYDWEQYANLGHTNVNDIVDVDGHVYSSMDIRNTNSTLSYQGTVYKAANWNFVVITSDPQQDSGTVSSSPTGLVCSDGVCHGSFPQGNVSFTATPSEDWALGYWDDGTSNFVNNPLIVGMDGRKNLSLTAKFFRIFRNAVGDFRQASGTYGNGSCVQYVRYETDLPIAACNGDASTCLSSAQSQNYLTGTTPRIGSVVVFGAASWNGNAGHVGIVSAISENGTAITLQDQNFVDANIIGSHEMSTSHTDILGYIHYTP